MLKYVIIWRDARRRRETLKHYSLYMTLLLFKRLYLSVDREYKNDLCNLQAIPECPLNILFRSLALVSQRKCRGGYSFIFTRDLIPFSRSCSFYIRLASVLFSFFLSSSLLFVRAKLQKGTRFMPRLIMHLNITSCVDFSKNYFAKYYYY